MGNNRVTKTRGSFRYVRRLRESTCKIPVDQMQSSEYEKFFGCSIPQINFKLFEYLHLLQKVSNMGSHIKSGHIYFSKPDGGPFPYMYLGEEVLYPEIRVPELGDLLAEHVWKNGLSGDSSKSICYCAIDDLLHRKIRESIFLLRIVGVVLRSQLISWEKYVTSRDGELESMVALNRVRGRIGELRRQKDMLFNSGAPRPILMAADRKLKIRMRMLEIIDR